MIFAASVAIQDVNGAGIENAAVQVKTTFPSGPTSPIPVSFEHEDDESLAIKVYTSHKMAQLGGNNRLDR
jgi:hypothetical protein